MLRLNRSRLLRQPLRKPWRPSLATALGLVYMLLPTHAGAHDFWLDARSHTLDVDAPFIVSARIGHADNAIQWPLHPNRVVAFRSIGPNGLLDHQNRIATASPSGQVTLPGLAPGVHVVTFETTQAFSELPAADFLSYLEEEGLGQIRDLREARGEDDTPGRELYSRRGKAIVTVGPASDRLPDHALKPVGLTLELVLAAIPAAGEEAPLQATIYYRGVPQPGVQVSLNALDGQMASHETNISKADGRLEFTMPAPGRYMLHAVWASPLEDARADFATVFSSLSFEVP